MANISLVKVGALPNSLEGAVPNSKLQNEANADKCHTGVLHVSVYSGLHIYI
jgi:hypothetical protein